MLAAVLLLTAVASPVVAQTSNPGDERAAWESYHEAVAEEANLVAEYKASQQALAELAARIKRLDEEIETTQAELAAAQARLAHAQDELLLGRTRLSELTELLATETQRLHNQAVAAYMGGGSTRSAEILAILRAQSPIQVASVREYAGTVVEHQAGNVDLVTKLEAEARELALKLAIAERIARDSRDEIDAKEKELQQKREEAKAARAENEVKLVEQKQLIARAQARRAELERRLYAIERESDMISLLLAQRQKDDKPADKVPIVRSPLESGLVDSTFGMREHPVFKEQRMHFGVDLGAGEATPIYAVADGVVVMTEEQEGYGLVTVVAHGNQLATVYAHQSRMEVKPGDSVKRGQRIGLVGESGYATGPHVHFEYRLLGKPIDPKPFIDFAELLPAVCERLRNSNREADRQRADSRPECRSEPKPAEPNPAPSGTDPTSTAPSTTASSTTRNAPAPTR